MNRRLILVSILVGGLLISSAANAWFFFIPTGAIQKALETDPDSISVSVSDRAFGQCAGFHLNQARKGITPGTPQERYPGAPPATEPTQTLESKFHSDMADVSLQRSSEREKVKPLAEAYSVRWSRVAGADLQANRQYGANLARGCTGNDIPLRFFELPAWQVRQEEKKRQQVEEERKRAQAEEEQRRVRVEEQPRNESKVTDTAVLNRMAPPSTPSAPGVDYVAEAKKSARILGCPTSDVKVTGVESNNILISANCGTGQQLFLTCDQSGVCLRR